MSIHKIQKQVKELRSVIKKHNTAYYNLDAPLISDQEYDALLEKLTNLEKQYPNLITSDSPTQTVGNPSSRGFKKINLIKPMLMTN